MQFALSTLVLGALATTALANGGGGGGGGSNCNTGPVQCCNSVQNANSTAIAPLLKSLGVVIPDPTVLVGVTCSPITVIGTGSDNCSGQTVCCENNEFHGIIAIGCTAIHL